MHISEAVDFVLAHRPGEDRYFAPYLRDHGVWEPAETALMAGTLQPGMTVVDVGAHVGYFSMLSALKVGLKGQVISLEPDPEHFRLLCANLLLNCCDNVEARRLAVSDQPGSGRLYLSRLNPGDQRIEPVPDRPWVEISLDTLDRVTKDRIVDFIKIDTQGAEERVLSGARKMLSKSRDRLAGIIEFAPGLLARANCSVDDFLDLLNRHGALIHQLRYLNGSAMIESFQNPRKSMHELARTLLSTGKEDASGNLFVMFSESAARRWMERIRAGSVACIE
ncbi:MAG: FkbM family methyltransferase [Wenzhouxiangella sp.]